MLVEEKEMDIHRIRRAVDDATRRFGLSDDEQQLLFDALRREELWERGLFRVVPDAVDHLSGALVGELIGEERIRQERRRRQRQLDEPFSNALRTSTWTR